jgi:hypothetical protein
MICGHAMICGLAEVHMMKNLLHAITVRLWLLCCRGKRSMTNDFAMVVRRGLLALLRFKVVYSSSLHLSRVRGALDQHPQPPSPTGLMFCAGVPHQAVGFQCHQGTVQVSCQSVGVGQF